MQEYNYNFEIRTLLSHFASAFNDVKIKRFDGKKYAKEAIKVPLTFAPKSHILADLVGLTDTIKLPAIAIEIKNQSRDNERIKNKIDDLIYKNTDGTYVNMKAIPWNINVEMTILAKFQEDLDQIVQNFSVHNNPYIIVSWQEPKSGRELRTEILWDGNISYNYPAKEQGPKEPPFRITATTNFTIKGYIFKTSMENSKPICFIETDYSFTDKFYCNYDNLLEYSQNLQTETYSITGRPLIRYASPYYIVEGREPKITIQGYGMGDVNAVFVSGSNDNIYPLTEYSPFTALNSFYGYPVKEFQKSDNSLTFTLPSPSSDGFVDIIAVNSCGYGKLTEDSNRCGRLENPYPINSPEHYSWTVLQYPYLNGLIVTSFLDPYCINYQDNVYVYEETDNIDKQAVINKIKELMVYADISLQELE